MVSDAMYSLDVDPSPAAIAGSKQHLAMLSGPLGWVQVNLLQMAADCHLVLARLGVLGANHCAPR
jgi:hypothetical protein